MLLICCCCYSWCNRQTQQYNYTFVVTSATWNGLDQGENSFILLLFFKILTMRNSNIKMMGGPSKTLRGAFKHGRTHAYLYSRFVFCFLFFFCDRDEICNPAFPELEIHKTKSVYGIVLGVVDKIPEEAVFWPYFWTGFHWSFSCIFIMVRGWTVSPANVFVKFIDVLVSLQLMTFLSQCYKAQTADI